MSPDDMNKAIQEAAVSLGTKLGKGLDEIVMRAMLRNGMFARGIEIEELPDDGDRRFRRHVTLHGVLQGYVFARFDGLTAPQVVCRVFLLEEIAERRLLGDNEE